MPLLKCSWRRTQYDGVYARGGRFKINDRHGDYDKTVGSMVLSHLSRKWQVCTDIKVWQAHLNTDCTSGTPFLYCAYYLYEHGNHSRASEHRCSFTTQIYHAMTFYKQHSRLSSYSLCDVFPCVCVLFIFTLWLFCYITRASTTKEEMRYGRSETLLRKKGLGPCER